MGNTAKVRIVRGDRSDAEAVLATLLVPTGPVLLHTGDLITGYTSHLTTSGYSDSTIRRYEQLWRTWLAQHLADQLVTDVDRGMVATALHAMKTAGQSEASIRQADSLISGALDWAARNRSPVTTPRVPSPRRGPYRRQTS